MNTLNNEYLSNSAKIIESALALKSSIEKCGYQYKNGIFLKETGKTYCVCISDIVYNDFELKKDYVYEFGGFTEDLDYIVITNNVEMYFTKYEFDSWFRIASDDEAERAIPRCYFNGKEIAWQDIPLIIRKHKYPHYFDKDGNDCYPEIKK